MGRYWAGEPKQVGGENAKCRAYRVQIAKRSQARSADKVYVPPGHKLSCDSRCGPDMLSNVEVLVRRPTREPVPRPNRKPGRYERLLGDEPVRVYVSLILRQWVMDRTHKEAVHLGEKVTLAMPERYYYWVGMASSVNGGSGDATPARLARRREIRYDGL